MSFEFRQWLEVNLGDELYKKKGIWMIPFADIEKDATEGYFFNYGTHHTGGSISDISKVQVGDKVSDHSLNWTPYWTVSGVNEDKQVIYLNPIEPNPLVTGVGAGGKKIDDFDTSVFDGSYEKKRVNDILKQWKSGQIDDIRDIAYLLLGTVPVNFGPNGSQGGWYAPTDTMSNRGGKKRMSAKEIMMKDASTIKNQFGFSVPANALNGTLDPRTWGEFVNGGTNDEEMNATRLEEEDFDNPKTIAKIILEHPQPSIKLRNVERLLDLYRGYHKYRAETKKIYSSDNFDNKQIEDLNEKWKNGRYTDKSILPIIHDVALKLSDIYFKNDKKRFDAYWHSKEKLIETAGEQGWDDVISAYEQAASKTNRMNVFDIYLQRKDKNKIKEMLDRETSAEAINWMLEHCLSRYSGFGYNDYEGEFEKTKSTPSFPVQYIVKNYDSLIRKIKEASDAEWYGENALKLIKNTKEFHAT